MWLSPRHKDRVVWRSLSLGCVTDNGDKLRSSCIKKGCSILHDSRGTDGFLWCAAVALHVLVRTVLEAIASKELLTCHASTDVGNSVHTLLSVSHCKIAPYNNMKEIVLAMSHYFWWSAWSYVLISFIYHLSNGMYFDRIPFWTESVQLLETVILYNVFSTWQIIFPCNTTMELLPLLFCTQGSCVWSFLLVLIIKRCISSLQ